ncbi:hypothetical protein BR93DRAFT_228280 [Coniochaeta sp. PMI_546]|nr:hypothetical protein BR93DRAFT_228280 [Coniochaeta sp. PMI_546]
MQSQARWVTHEEVLHRTSRVLARVAGHIGQDLPFMKRIADELDFFHEAIHTMRDSDPIANLSIDKYNTARDTALEAVDSLVSRGRLDWEPAQRDGNSTRIVFAPGLDHPGTHGLCRLYKCLEADSEGSLAHDKELLRDLSPVQAAEFADSVSPLRRELGQILGHLTLKDRRATWDPIGSEKTQGHLNSLLDAIVKTWEKNRPPNRKKKTSTPQLIGEAETVNLRMDGTWSRHAEGAGSFSLIFRFASPRTLQLAKSGRPKEMVQCLSSSSEKRLVLQFCCEPRQRNWC